MSQHVKMIRNSGFRVYTWSYWDRPRSFLYPSSVAASVLQTQRRVTGTRRPAEREMRTVGQLPARPGRRPGAPGRDQPLAAQVWGPRPGDQAGSPRRPPSGKGINPPAARASPGSHPPAGALAATSRREEGGAAPGHREESPPAPDRPSAAPDPERRLRTWARGARGGGGVGGAPRSR